MEGKGGRYGKVKKREGTGNRGGHEGERKGTGVVLLASAPRSASELISPSAMAITVVFPHRVNKILTANGLQLNSGRLGKTRNFRPETLNSGSARE